MNLRDENTKQLDNFPFLYTNESTNLYTNQHNFMDFNVDDNGLWVIFAVNQSNNTAVMKVDVNAMTPQYIWNITINHKDVGEMFIVCGVLYAVDSGTDRYTKIRFVYDLYKDALLDISNLSFTNPFKRTTMIGYNHKNKELYTVDKGNWLTYPVRYYEGSDKSGDLSDDPPVANKIQQDAED